MGYCDKLNFKTSYRGEDTRTIVSFNAKLLKELLLPSNEQNVSLNEVITEIVEVYVESEKKILVILM